MDFKEVYTPPFKIAMNWVYATSSNSTTTFTAFDETSQLFLSLIVRLLNGEKTAIKFYKDEVYSKDAKIFIKLKSGKKGVSLVRGWDKMIGKMGLKPAEAAKIQDDFIDWVVETITEERKPSATCCVVGNPQA